jgi:tetratricopeptide (TPR) repeat protein
MTHKTLLKQIEQWHADGGHEKIEKAVLALPEAERDYDLSCMLARALNNMSRYEDALRILLSVREQGRDDALWHFRTAYSLFYLDREAESIPYFEHAIKLGDDDPNTYQMLLWARKAAKKHLEPKATGTSQPAKPFVPKAVAIIELNMRLRPETRTMRYDDGLDLMLRSKNLGYVNGGDTRRSPEGEIESCSIEIKLSDDSDETRQAILAAAEKLEATKGSRLKYRFTADTTETEYPIGKLEGFAVYLNGADLPDEVYKNNSIREVVDKLCGLLSRNGTLVFSHWNGPKETALYFYGEGGIETMLAKAAPFLKAHPLCEKCRIVRLA